MTGLRIGFAGVGFMGKGMVHNLLKKIVEPTPNRTTLIAPKILVFDKNHQNISEIIQKDRRFEAHLDIVSDPTDLGERCDVVSLSLPSESIAEKLLFGDSSSHGLYGGFKSRGSSASAPLVVMDHGTVSRKFVLDCHRRARDDYGAVYLDGKITLDRLSCMSRSYDYLPLAVVALVIQSLEFTYYSSMLIAYLLYLSFVVRSTSFRGSARRSQWDINGNDGRGC
jgi:NAD binding domain of 6-phosphogluconate dehydrogenase